MAIAFVLAEAQLSGSKTSTPASLTRCQINVADERKKEDVSRCFSTCMCACLRVGGHRGTP